MSALDADLTVSEALEATCRARMTELANLSIRGWDGEKERSRRLAELDGLLDEWRRATCT